MVSVICRLSENCEYLGMRGVCLYILNMFSNSEEGRDELSRNCWISYNKC